MCVVKDQAAIFAAAAGGSNVKKQKNSIKALASLVWLKQMANALHCDRLRIIG